MQIMQTHSTVYRNVKMYAKCGFTTVVEDHLGTSRGVQQK